MLNQSFQFESNSEGLRLVSSPLVQIKVNTTEQVATAENPQIREADLSDPATVLALGGTMLVLGSVIGLGVFLDRNGRKNRQLNRQQEEQ